MKDQKEILLEQIHLIENNDPRISFLLHSLDVIEEYLELTLFCMLKKEEKNEKHIC